METVLVTGAAGFVGYHTVQAFLAAGFRVVGLDNLNDYYSPKLKRDRLAQVSSPNFDFVEADVADAPTLSEVFAHAKPTYVVHLAAQAGVRYSIENPSVYIQSNLVGFGNILEACRHSAVEHLVYASSSSVYGLNRKMPFSTHDGADHPISLYAATKKANEAMAHSYSHLFKLPTTGLRFFTVYGPWGRPDMAPMLFASAISEGRPIQVFNEGKMRRDFTYVGDIAQSVLAVTQRPPAPNPTWDPGSEDPATSSAPFRICNIGASEPVELMRFISLLEANLGKKAIMDMQPLQAGDVVDTYADTSDLEAITGFAPAVSIEEGIAQFVDWYRSYFGS